MSEPLKEGSPLDKHRGTESITEFDRRVYESMAKAMWLPDDFKEYMVQYMALNQPPIPVGQLFGFTQFTATPAATISVSEGTTSTSYVDLATAGPTLTGLSDGVYAIFFGAGVYACTGGGAARMSIDVNGAGAVDADAIRTTSLNGESGARVIIETLDAGGNNTLTAKYKASAGTASFDHRWLIVVRTQNL